MENVHPLVARGSKVLVDLLLIPDNGCCRDLILLGKRLIDAVDDHTAPVIASHGVDDDPHKRLEK